MRLPGLKSIGCLQDFWCCRNKWSKIAPYSSWIRCISLMCSATFSMPFSASVDGKIVDEKRPLPVSGYVVIFRCVKSYMHNMYVTHQPNGSVLRIVDQWDCVAVATIADISKCAGSVLSNTIPMRNCAVALDSVQSRTLVTLDFLHLKRQMIDKFHKWSNKYNVKQEYSNLAIEKLWMRFKQHSSWPCFFFISVCICVVCTSVREVFHVAQSKL